MNLVAAAFGKAHRDAHNAADIGFAIFEAVARDAFAIIGRIVPIPW